jgi:hypothetical protein
VIGVLDGVQLWHERDPAKPEGAFKITLPQGKALHAWSAYVHAESAENRAPRPVVLDDADIRSLRDDIAESASLLAVASTDWMRVPELPSFEVQRDPPRFGSWIICAQKHDGKTYALRTFVHDNPDQGKHAAQCVEACAQLERANARVIDLVRLGVPLPSYEEVVSNSDGSLPL